MADSASESDSGSICEGGPIMMPPSPVSREQLYKRIESLQQQNRVLKMELDTFKLRVKSLQEENRHLRQASVNIQAKAEQEEEFISNTLLKKIQVLKKEKETLAHHYEQEEECLTNDLSKKLNQLRQEKCKLEQTLEQEQECLVNKLMRKIEKLEAETNAKQTNLEQLRREKVELENTLEQEQEALVNRLWKRMNKLEAEKRNLQSKIEVGHHSSQDQPGPSAEQNHVSPGSGSGETNPHLRLSGMLNHSASGQPLGFGHRSPLMRSSLGGDDDVIALSGNVQHLRTEVDRLKAQLNVAQQQHSEKMTQFASEERQIREENLRLQRRLQLEMERREALCRHLSESESSLEMEDERHFHESMAAHGPLAANILSACSPLMNSGSLTSAQPLLHQTVRPRPGSSPGPFVPCSGSRPISPGSAGSRDIMSPPSPVSRCHQCNSWVGGSIAPLIVTPTGCSNQIVSSSSPPIRHSSRERFARPAAPPSAERDRSQEPRTPVDSIMSSPAPSPAPLEAVLSPAAAPSPSSSPMDTSNNFKIN